jgi:hypothetical protein
MLLIVGGVLVAAILVFTGIKLFSAQGQSSPGSSPGPSSQNTTGAGGNGNTCIQGQTCAQGGNVPIETQPDFVDVVKNQVAQGLHLAPDQLQTKLQTGLQITDLAQQQGLSLDQWHTLELNAAKAGIQKLVSEGKLSQDAGNAQTQQWQANLDNMDSGIQLMLGGCPPQPAGVTGCPPAGPGVIKKG